MMNRIKTGAITLAVVLGAAVMALMPTAAPQEAEADPTNVLGLNKGICIALGVAFGGLEQVAAVSACGSFAQQSGGMQQYVGCLRAVDVPRVLDPGEPSDQSLIDAGYPNPIPRDGVRLCTEGVEEDIEGTSILVPTPDDFAALDLDANQLHVGQSLFVIAFVNDDASVRFTTDVGQFSTLDGVTSNYICNTAGEDPDCDGDETTIGDGVVVAELFVTADDDLGTHELVVVQEGIGWPFSFTVVGPPDEITLEPLFGKPTISVGGTAPTPGTVINPDDPAPDDGVWDTIPGPSGPDTDCNFAATVDGVLGANSHPNKMVVVAKALDSDGNEVVGALLTWDVVWDSPDTLPEDSTESDIANAALPSTPTLDTGALGIGFPQFICAGDEPGTVEMTVGFDTVLSPGSDGAETTSIEITVIGEPANLVLSVDPPQLACDGTASATVTATLTTEDGEPVSNGTDVDWSVQVLGTANPLSSETTGGVTTTTVRPFAGVDTGVPVTARVGDLAASTLVRCGPGSAPTTPGETPGGGAGPGGQPPIGTVRPPDTGSAGDVDGQAALNVWAAVALFAGAMGLVGARLALRKA